MRVCQRTTPSSWQFPRDPVVDLFRELLSYCFFEILFSQVVRCDLLVLFHAVHEDSPFKGLTEDISKVLHGVSL